MLAVNFDGRELKCGEIPGVNPESQGSVPRQDLPAILGEKTCCMTLDSHSALMNATVLLHLSAIPVTS